MFIVCLIISYFVRNAFTVDDLGLLLAMMGVIILITAVIFRAVRLLAWMMIPTEYRNELLRRNGRDV